MIKISKTTTIFNSTSGFSNMEVINSVSSHTNNHQMLHDIPAPKVEELLNATIATLKSQESPFGPRLQNNEATPRDVIITALLSEAIEVFKDKWTNVRIDIRTDIGGMSFICKEDDGCGVFLPEKLLSGGVFVLQAGNIASKTFKARYEFFEMVDSGTAPDFSIKPLGTI